MNLLVIRPLGDPGLSSNSVANRISDRSFDVIDFITMPLWRNEKRTGGLSRIVMNYSIPRAAINSIGRFDKKRNRSLDMTVPNCLSSEVMNSLSYQLPEGQIGWLAHLNGLPA